jgi:small subunit ribosomal protein S9
MVKKKEKKEKIIFSVGKRDTAVAKAIVKPGNGKTKINSKPLEIWGSEQLRLWIKEPLILSDDLSKRVDIDVNVRGGGVVSQAEATRQAIAKGLVNFSGNDELRNKFLEYNRNLLVYDPRRNETHHSSGKGCSKRGSRRHKQRSKR